MTSLNQVLTLSQCSQCERYLSLSPYACKFCGSDQLRHKDISGEGVVRAITEIYRAPSTEWRKYAPYQLVLVRLLENVTVMGHVFSDVGIGQEVVLSKEKGPEGGLVFIRKKS